MERFEYAPLDLDDFSFRLVRLLKEDDGPIQCELIHTCFIAMETIMEYEALSYTWGSEEKPHEIEINGCMMPVTENLHLALRHLRHEYQDRILWIDAICIDQNNDDERGHQVRQMGTIYNRAERVVIWLGQATRATDIAMQCMCRYEEATLTHACKDWGTSDRRWSDIWSSIQEYAVLYTEDQQREGLDDLLFRAWFERIWIIQEAANARKAKIMCGTYSISPRTFSTVLSLTKTSIKPHCQAILDILPGSSRKQSWWSQRRDLSTLLSKFGTFTASDSRDVIYGLLGISSDASTFDVLIPDYAKSMDEIISDTLIFLLGFDNKQRPRPRLPQWTIYEFLRNLDALGSEVFIWAVERGQKAVVKHLISTAKVDLNKETADGKIPLWYAYTHGLEGLLRVLLKAKKVDVNTTHKSETLLHRAVTEKSETLVKLLVETGRANINARDKHGQTPLWVALVSESPKIAQLLFDTGDADVDITNSSGKPLMWDVVRLDDHDAIKLLLENAKPCTNISDKDGCRILEWIIMRHSDEILQLFVDVSNADINLAIKGRTAPLASAVRSNFDTKVKILLDTGRANVSAGSIGGLSLLRWAMMNSSKDMVGMLLDASKTADLDREERDGFTLLTWASLGGHTQMVELLLGTRKVDVRLKDEFEQTPLSAAAKIGNTETVKLLLNFGSVEIDSPDSLGRTALFWAAHNGHERAVKILLDKGHFDADLKDTFAQTPLSVAAQNGYDKVVKVLLDTDQVNVNSIGGSLRLTPLDWAFSHKYGNYLRVINLLSERGGMATSELK